MSALLLPSRRPLRLVLATALLALGAGTGTADAVPAVVPVVVPTGGTQCPTRQVSDYTKQAAAVFVGSVTSSTSAPLPDGAAGQQFTQTVEVDTVYTGRISSPTVTVVSQQVRRQCSLGALAAGTTYMFFVQGEDDTWSADGGSGTAPAGPQLVAQVTRLLGEGRAPVAPEAEGATFTDLGVDAPARLSRVAAPGAALVIIGLLGLLVAGRAGRRRS